MNKLLKQRLRIIKQLTEEYNVPNINDIFDNRMLQNIKDIPTYLKSIYLEETMMCIFNKQYHLRLTTLSQNAKLQFNIHKVITKIPMQHFLNINNVKNEEELKNILNRMNDYGIVQTISEYPFISPLTNINETKLYELLINKQAILFLTHFGKITITPYKKENEKQSIPIKKFIRQYIKIYKEVFYDTK